jgi:shikimate kinase
VTGSTRVTTDKIYLVGFMTAGKTTVGRALADRLSWRCFDLDSEIETVEHQTVAEVFASKGEAYFRGRERDALLRLLPERHAVVATGGGTFVDPANRAAILADGCSIWLDLTFKAVVARLPTDGRRPLAANREQMEALYYSRRSCYELCDFRVDVTAAAVEAVVEQILDRVNW